MSKTVIEMAREAGGRAQQNKNCDVEYLLSAESIERLVELARADEREACAKVCDDKHDTWRWGDGADSASGPRDCASAIRARSNT